MKKTVLTEAELRSKALPQGTARYVVEPGVFVTPLAKEYLQERNIELVVAEEHTVMSRSPIPAQGNRTYLDYRTGEGYREKPEEMTHLRGNLLVAKTHPRIALRGKLDLLQAHILECWLLAEEEGKERLGQQLGEVLECVRRVLAAEVGDTTLAPQVLFGLSPSELRRISHNTAAEIGIPPPVPCHTMGRLALRLNTLRAQVREAELAAVTAFSQPGEAPRPDLIQALNRLSSAVYILFCRLLVEQNGGAAHAQDA